MIEVALLWFLFVVDDSIGRLAQPPPHPPLSGSIGMVVVVTVSATMNIVEKGYNYSFVGGALLEVVFVVVAS